MPHARPIRGQRRNATSLLAMLLSLTLVALASAPASVRAQAAGSSVEEARQFLATVPGLDLRQLNVFGDAVGDVDGADAAWGASGQVDVNDRLREWVRDLAESDYGWGQLPAAGEPALITFVGLTEPPSFDGRQTAVLHTGLGGGGDLTPVDSQRDLASGVRLLHSAGVWFAEDSFFPQNGSSPVSDGEISWFGEPARGAGGVAMPEGVLVNLIPLDRWVNYYRLTVEGTKPLADPPVPPTRDVLYGPGGSQYLRVRELLDLRHVLCLSTSVTPLPGGRRTVELNLQALGDYPAKNLARLRLDTFDAEKQPVGTVKAKWTRLPDASLYRGLFTVGEPAARSAAIAPPGGTTIKGKPSLLKRIGVANRTGIFGLDGAGLAIGSPECGRLSIDVDVCGGPIIDAFTSTGLVDAGEGPVEAVPGVAADGSITCDISVSGEPAARLVQGVTPVTDSRAIAANAEASGCEATRLAPEQDGSILSCDGFVAWQWRQPIPALASLDGGLGAVQSIVLFRPLPSGAGALADGDLADLLAPVSEAMSTALGQARADLAVKPSAGPG